MYFDAVAVVSEDSMMIINKRSGKSVGKRDRIPLYAWSFATSEVWLNGLRVLWDGKRGLPYVEVNTEGMSFIPEAASQIVNLDSFEFATYRLAVQGQQPAAILSRNAEGVELSCQVRRLANDCVSMQMHAQHKPQVLVNGAKPEPRRTTMLQLMLAAYWAIARGDYRIGGLGELAFPSGDTLPPPWSDVTLLDEGKTSP